MTMFLPDMNTQAQTASGTKVLMAYFSHSGNTRAMARQIAEATGGDLFEIVPAAAYPAEYGAVVDQAKKEIGGGVRPALKGRLPDVGAYDVIFVGSPCWWSTVAPPVATFLADCDWAGKTVVPFMTHEAQPHGPQRRGYSETLCGRYPARRASPTRRGRERLAGRRAEVGSGIESDKINYNRCCEKSESRPRPFSLR